MSARFTSTINAFEKGAQGIKPEAAIKIIQTWEDELANTDVSGAKGIMKDLEALRKALEKDEPDSERVLKLVGELAEATTKIAGRVDDEKVAPKLEELGRALEEAGQMVGTKKKEKA